MEKALKVLAGIHKKIALVEWGLKDDAGHPKQWPDPTLREIAVISLEIERQLGAMLSELWEDKNRGIFWQVIAGDGITRDQFLVWKSLARCSQADFDAYIDDCRVNGELPNQTEVIQLADGG